MLVTIGPNRVKAIFASLLVLNGGRSTAEQLGNDGPTQVHCI